VRCFVASAIFSALIVAFFRDHVSHINAHYARLYLRNVILMTFAIDHRHAIFSQRRIYAIPSTNSTDSTKLSDVRPSDLITDVVLVYTEFNCGVFCFEIVDLIGAFYPEE
jgi:hypothetical protein